MVLGQEAPVNLLGGRGGVSISSIAKELLLALHLGTIPGRLEGQSVMPVIEPRLATLQGKHPPTVLLFWLLNQFLKKLSHLVIVILRIQFLGPQNHTHSKVPCHKAWVGWGGLSSFLPLVTQSL